MPAYWNGSVQWDSGYEPDHVRSLAYQVRTDGTSYHHANDAPDQDWVRFTAQEGRSYVFALANEVGADFIFRVYDAAGRDLSGNRSTNWNWTCPMTDTYFVMLWDYQNNQIGSFDFSITGAELDYAVDIPSNHVTLYLDPADGPSSYQLVANCSNGSASIQWQSSNSSVVTVSATGLLQAKAAGTAVVTATCTAGGTSDTVLVTVNADNYEPNDVQGQAKLLVVGPDFQSHTFLPKGATTDYFDWLKFDAIQGKGYVIELANEWGSNSYFKLYNEAGVALTGNVNTRHEFHCAATGTYYLQVWTDYYLQWTSYLIRVLPAYWNGNAQWDNKYEPNNAGFVSCYLCTDQDSLFYEIPHAYGETHSDWDWYRFYAVQNSTYILTVTNELGANFYFRLYDAASNPISGYQDVSLTWTCPTTGIYHVAIWDQYNDQIGSYDFSVTRSVGPGNDTDSDVDAMADCWEIYYFGNGNLNRDGFGDWDSDDLIDKDEFANMTHPKDPDSDDDRITDGYEVKNGLNPLGNDAFADKDSDEFCNLREFLAGTRADDPNDKPTVPLDVYVSVANNSGVEHGTKSAPYNTIQEGIIFAGPIDKVFVSAGVYEEHVKMENVDVLEGGWNQTFDARWNFGGAGLNPPAAYETVIDGQGSGRCLGISGIASSTIIDGFTIQNGIAEKGGGVNINQSFISIFNCRFVNNQTTGSGHGAAIAISDSDSNIFRCSFENNQSNMGGGAISLYKSDPEITNCSFANNSAATDGGAIYAVDASPIITNSLFYDNTADNRGGAVFMDNSTMEIINSTFYGNSANGNGEGLSIYGSSPIIFNTIVWGDSAPAGAEIFAFDASPTVTYSNVQGGYPGTGNMQDDPLFIDASSGDFRLLTASPCVDAANSDGAQDYDMAEKSRYDDPSIENKGSGTFPYYDIGAYEYQLNCEGDMDGDKALDGFDLYTLIEAKEHGYITGDFNHDGLVNDKDLKVFAKRFGYTDCP